MKTMIIVETTQGRENLLGQAEAHLTEDDAIVKITDTISVDSSTLTVPADPNAEVVAREPPKLLPGGVTALVSYVRMSSSLLKGVEYRMEQTKIISSRDVTLKPERVGKNPKPASASETTA